MTQAQHRSVIRSAWSLCALISLRTIAAALFLMLAAIVPARAQVADFTVTAPTMNAYVINSTSNPALNLQRGHTYTFNVNTPGHPFYIKTAQVTGTSSTYDLGVIGNGTTSGTLTFQVPGNAPSGLFYQCSVHSAMTGAIAITGTVAVPALSPFLEPALLLLLALLGLTALGRRPRVQRA